MSQSTSRCRPRSSVSSAGMSRSTVIGLDLGTTGARAVLADVSGATLAVHEAPYDLHTPSPAGRAVSCRLGAGCLRGTVGGSLPGSSGGRRSRDRAHRSDARTDAARPGAAAAARRHFVVRPPHGTAASRTRGRDRGANAGPPYGQPAAGRISGAQARLGSGSTSRVF